MSYKTAWYLCHRIRAALNEVDAQLLKGIVEIDETFVGSEMNCKGRSYKGNKTVVVGAMKRGGSICLKVVMDADREACTAPSAPTLTATRSLRRSDIAAASMPEETSTPTL